MDLGGDFQASLVGPLQAVYGGGGGESTTIIGGNVQPWAASKILRAYIFDSPAGLARPPSRTDVWHENVKQSMELSEQQLQNIIDRRIQK